MAYVQIPNTVSYQLAGADDIENSWNPSDLFDKVNTGTPITTTPIELTPVEVQKKVERVETIPQLSDCNDYWLPKFIVVGGATLFLINTIFAK